MTANLLTVNSSKSEFLLIGLKEQVIHDSTLNTTHFTGNLGFIFDKHLAFYVQISAISRPGRCHIRLDSFVVSVLTVMPPQRAPLQPT